MRTENFRPQDYLAAQREHDCIEDLLVEIKVHTTLGDYSAAARTAKDVIASLQELQRLESYKRNHDKLKAVVNSMSARGIDLEVVVRNA
ncbi:hypothetical protein BK128_09515 [Viridibacillus sp. FSL H7-0596]|uniref:hypothetical protein n=1 Tax=Viridibacillus sp. FSL H7-0596 TaxID=1928923 RepID=UPI00097011CF|nr:hypothetical protein [Viridibacillus sp. FSL H7-0596]OMC86893.1 hypothetical protein BK128_09515 [Viridibacillus sp. FSL H7-0596]